MGLKIAIFGSNSFSGSNAVSFFSKRGFDVYSFSKTRKNINENFYKFNINNKKDIKKAINIIKQKKIKFIINYISKSLVEESWKKPEDWLITNSLSLPMFYIHLSKIKNIKKIIHFSTPEVYGNTTKKIDETAPFNPSTPYALSRVTADMTANLLFKNFNLPIIITRTSNVYGEGQENFRIIPKTINFLKKNKKIPLHGAGKTKRNFIHIDDVNEALYLLLYRGKNGETYNITGNDFISIKDLVRIISNIQNKNFKKHTKNVKDRKGKDLNYILSNKKIKKLRWSPKKKLNIELKNMIKNI